MHFTEDMFEQAVIELFENMSRSAARQHILKRCAPRLSN